MTTYTEYDLSSKLANGTVMDWSNKSLWAIGSVPSDPTALVVFQALHDTSGVAKSYTVQIKCGESYDVCTLDMSGSTLQLAGALTLETGINVISDTAEVVMQGGTLKASTLHLAGTPSVHGIVGSGEINVSESLYIQSSIISTGSGGNGCGLLSLLSSWFGCGPSSSGSVLTVNGGTLVNAGLLEADQGSTLIVDVANFTNFHAGTLSGGTYESAGGTLDLKMNGLITTDAANIVLNGAGNDVINSYNSATGKYAAIQTSLTTIAAGGSLTIEDTQYCTSLSLTDSGSITVEGFGATLSAANLTIAKGGSLILDGETPLLNHVLTIKQLVNNGTITIEANSVSTPDVVTASSITGTGTILLGTETTSTLFGKTLHHGASVELTGSVANTIQFSDGAGTVILDQPKSMTGNFAGFTAGDRITLSGIGHAPVSGVSYSGDATSGVLTLHEGSSIVKLAFEGGYTASNFSVTADSHGVEIVGVGHFSV